ncbi:ribonuclease HII [Acidipropionibacterium virtanenii]|uniref:Ribonuclease HII n=1 Tax=Acidipropionibacterium virtanenii TaxID=2057246 RepID=A0A344UTD0_9ACTN|nr:ribonuclease HII [Acidipropionibacterium virtanenii]AXE38528.1 Ribonuclease HII [Acidipropionibacterium virtanenii]
MRIGPGPRGPERLLRRAGLGPVAGCDEAGRGACAGPLVAAAAILQDGPAGRIEELDDSKRLTARARDRCFDRILERARAVAWVQIPACECDRLGIQEADIQALRRAVARLAIRPGYVISDGFAVDGLDCPGLGMWKGDATCACVAAASVVAKVVRDRIMVAMDAELPGYGFAIHKGYGTAMHQECLNLLGPSPQHRLSYANVAASARVHTS